jgi:hypothetical protein
MTKRIIRAITDITQPKRNGLTTDTALRRWLRHLNDLAGYYTDSDQNVRTLWRGGGNLQSGELSQESTLEFWTIQVSKAREIGL